MSSFELDHAHYLSTPDYGWNAMVKFTDVNLKLISHNEKHQFVESTMKALNWYLYDL